MPEPFNLDELTVPAPQTGTPIQRLGITAQFSLPEGHHSKARRAALDILLDAYDLCPQGFHRWMAANDKRARPIPENSTVFKAAAEADLATLIDSPDKQMSLAIFPDGAAPKWQASATMLGNDPQLSWLSTVVVSMPPSTVLRNASEYIRRVHNWAARLRPQYGTAGFALVDELGMAHHRFGATWPWLQRHPGLDVEPFTLQPKPGRLVTVNWITILGEDVIETLGGLASVRQRLHIAALPRGISAPELLPYNGGVLIISGSLSGFGEGSTIGIPDSLRVVNAALRPARFEDYPDYPSVHLLDAPRSLDRRQATLDWIRRFDDEK